MRYVWDFVYLVMLATASPWLAWKAVRTGKYRRGLAQKCWGAVPPRNGTTPCIWLHAVSVGEVQVAATLAPWLRGQWPQIELAITTTTRTGYELARRRFPDDLVAYAPLDFSWAVDRALRRLRPLAILLVELELWPNLIARASQQGISVAIVNGRLSDRSFAGYRRIRPLIRHLLSRLAVVAVQNELYASRFQELGCPSNKLVVTGSVKFDGIEVNRNNPGTLSLRTLAGIDAADQVFLAGSTQAPEEFAALEVFRSLSAAHPNLRLIIVPRHPERFDEVAQLLARSGLEVTRWTRWRDQVQSVPDNSQRPKSLPRILLVDTVGELRFWWGLADIALVGGSLSTRGGQNMIEPAAYGAAVCFGPNTQNFRDIATLLLEAHGAVRVASNIELRGFVTRCLDDPNWASELGGRAARLVQLHRGACQRTVTALTPVMAMPPCERRVRASERKCL